MSIQSYPLCWPAGWKRTPSAARKHGQFRKEFHRLSMSEGLIRVLRELERLGASRDEVVISTNVRTRLDGLPRSNEPEPQDTGAACYWQIGKQPMRCMAIDAYLTVADNLAAIAATLEAMRAIERHGGASILDRAFTGFAALPEKTTQSWRYHLGFGEEQPVTPELIKSAYRDLLKRFHPDIPETGNRERFEEITLAYENALTELTA